MRQHKAAPRPVGLSNVSIFSKSFRPTSGQEDWSVNASTIARLTANGVMEMHFIAPFAFALVAPVGPDCGQLPMAFSLHLSVIFLGAIVVVSC